MKIKETNKSKALEIFDKLELRDGTYRLQGDDYESIKKAFNTLLKENEKLKKELSLEIEKNRKLQIIEDKFDIICFRTDSLNEITGLNSSFTIDIKPKPNIYSVCSGNLLTEEEFNVFDKDRVRNQND